MKSNASIIFVFLSLIFSGCPARSLYPLFTETDAVFNPSLVGQWNAEGETYTFEQLHDKRYRLVIRSVEESDSAVYEVQAGKIGSSWFLDSYPIKNSDEHHYLSVHLFTKMEMNGDTLRIASLETDWLSTMIVKKKIHITHVKLDNEIILTAPTLELQKLFVEIGNTKEAFSNTNTLIRIR